MKPLLFKSLAGAAALCLATTVAAQSRVDEDLPVYEKTAGVSGNLSSVGSDTLANLMTLWAEEFKRVYPNVNVQIQAAGSSTAPPALTEGTSNIGPMSRLMKDKEIEAFEKRGFKLVDKSEINANPKDQPGADEIVWRLPPSLSTSRENPELRAAMEAIGESDRMTLLFRKGD